MPKCIMCRAHNAAKECEKHYNAMSLMTLTSLLRKLNNHEEIETTCEDHRNPLKLVVTHQDFLDRVDRLTKYKEKAFLIRSK